MSMSLLAASMLDSIRTRRVRSGVVGLGYVGLPLAVEFARAGYSTTGIDLDAAKVNAIDEARSYIDDVPSADIVSLRAAGRQDRFDYERIQQVAKVVVDTRNAIASPRPNVVRLGAPRTTVEELALV